MSDALQQHRALERELIYIRWKYAGLESEEEESILDAMEEVWYELSEEEQDELNSEGTKSLIRDNDDKEESPMETPWIVIYWDSSNKREHLCLAPETVEKLQRIYGESWYSVPMERGAAKKMESIHDLLTIAQQITGLTREQIEEHGGFILCDRVSQKNIKWPELKEL